MHLSLVILGTCTIGPLSCYCVIYHLRYLVARLFTFLLPPSDFCHRDLTSTKGLSFATEKKCVPTSNDKKRNRQQGSGGSNQQLGIT